MKRVRESSQAAQEVTGKPQSAEWREAEALKEQCCLPLHYFTFKWICSDYIGLHIYIMTMVVFIL